MECSCKVVLKVVRGKVAKLNASSVQKLGVNPWDATAGVEDVAEGKTFYAGSSEKKVGTYDANVEQMKGVDLTEINYEGGYVLGSERDYVEAQPMFQYWANVILFGNEEPQPLPDLPTLQTKVVEPKTIEQEVTADTGYELEKVVVLGADVVETIAQQNYDLMHFMDYFKYVAQGIPMASDAEYMAAEEYCQNKIISIYGGANGQN